MPRQHNVKRDEHFGLLVEPDTLITSKTDLKGAITYCNRDFLAYSGYGEEELIGKPHNIIRHKDMPACAFKLLWDYIQSGREIFAFVKNLTKHKEHYWVFTNVTPSFDNLGNIIGYYSVRRAPNLAVIPTIEALYKDLRALESKGGYEHSLKALQEFVQAQNKSYNHIICDLQKIDS